MLNQIQKGINRLNWLVWGLAGETDINDDIKIYIISYPKSGRTWLRMLLGKVICEKFNLDESNILYTTKLTLAADLPGVNWSHDGSGNNQGKKFRKFVSNKSAFRNKKVLFIYRDPKDLIVSNYFQATKRVSKYTDFTGSISQFIRHPNYGIHKIVDFYNIWHRNQHIPEDFLFITYENLHSDTNKILRSVVEFIGIKEVEEEIIQKAVDFASFQNMRNMEKNKIFKHHSMKPGDTQDEESYKVRKGKIGGYVDYLTTEDIEYIDTVISQENCPFYKKANSK